MKAAKGEQARRLKDAAKFADSALLRLEALRLGRDLPGCAGENADLHLLAVSDLLDALELAMLAGGRDTSQFVPMVRLLAHYCEDRNEGLVGPGVPLVRSELEGGKP